MIAALYIDKRGPYANRPDVDAWDIERDARKYVGPRPPDLIWGPSSGVRLDEGFHSKAERDAARAAGRKPVKRLSTVQNIVTPPAFAELLIGLAKSAAVRKEAA